MENKAKNGLLISQHNCFVNIQLKTTQQGNLPMGNLTGVSGNSRSRSFPRMEASDSRSRTLGMDFFIPFLFPNFGNGFFPFPSRSRNLGMNFFIPFPFPNFGNGFFNSLPVPELWEWNFLFPFPNPQKSFPLTPEHCVIPPAPHPS